MNGKRTVCLHVTLIATNILANLRGTALRGEPAAAPRRRRWRLLPESGGRSFRRRCTHLLITLKSTTAQISKRDLQY